MKNNMVLFHYTSTRRFGFGELTFLASSVVWEPVLSLVPAPDFAKPPTPVPARLHVAALRSVVTKAILRWLLPECCPQQVLCGALLLTRNHHQTSVRQQLTLGHPVCRRDRTVPSYVGICNARDEVVGDLPDKVIGDLQRHFVVG